MKPPRALGSWLRSLRPDREALPRDAVAGASTGVAAIPDGMASARPGGREPDPRAVRELRGPDRRRAHREHAPDGDHHHERGRPRRRARRSGAAGRGRAEALFLLTVLAGAVDDRGRAAAPRPLHAVRLALGDDRLPHRRRGEHRLRPAPRPHRRRRRGRSRSPRRSTCSPSRRDRPPALAAPASARWRSSRARRARGSARSRRGRARHPDADRRSRRRGHARRGQRRASRRASRRRTCPTSGSCSRSASSPARSRSRRSCSSRVPASARRRRTRTARRRTPSRDFIAQGVGNVASGLFRGQPVGGSVGQTALNVAAGRADALGGDLLRRLDGA